MTITVPDFNDLTVAVLGLGASGLASAKALVSSGADVWAWDDSDQARAKAAGEGVPIVDLFACDWSSVESLVLSPGIPHTFPAPNPVVAKAKEAGVKIIGDVELLAMACPDATFVGITGTNGKSTTTALVGHIVQACGLVNQVGGNLGPPPMDFQTLAAGGVYVLEMSSYQLELTHTLAFDVAVLLNISPDHLDRHGGLEGYVQAKKRIFAGAKHKFCGIDDAESADLQREQRAVPISGLAAVDGPYCIDGLLHEDGVPVLDISGHTALKGSHNAQNAAAAYACCRALGLEPAAICEAIESFPGLAHRQEQITVIDGVTFINDSKATNVDAAVRALSSFENIHWIVGGLAKEGGLQGIEPGLDTVEHAYLIGEAAAEFEAFLAGKVETTRCGILSEAVNKAFSGARLAGGVVLLSPACASFDQFPNFEARGEAFRAAVLSLYND